MSTAMYVYVHIYMGIYMCIYIYSHYQEAIDDILYYLWHIYYVPYRMYYATSVYMTAFSATAPAPCAALQHR